MALSKNQVIYVSSSKQRNFGVNLGDLNEVDFFESQQVVEAMFMTRKYLILAQR